MKKFLKFLLFFILFVFIVLFTAPFLFKGKIIKIANEQIANNVNANAHFDDIKLSFFKQFPFLSASVKNLSVTGIGDFEGDTLAYIESFDLAVNVVSAIKMENIEIKKIAIVNPVFNAIILKDGKANWDIAKETAEVPEPEEDTTTSGFSAKIALKSFIIENARIIYDDRQGSMLATLNGFNFILSGDLSQDFSSIVINSNTEKLNFLMSGIRYLKDVVLNIHIDVDANLKDKVFILKENSFALNDFILKIDGSVEMPDSADMNFDMAYATGNTDFKTLLSLVPAVYMRDFAELKAAGLMELNGTIKGALGDETTPDVKGKLLVQDAMFSYPDLPKNTEKINIDIDYFYDGKQMDNTTVDVNKFHIEMGGNPVDIALNLKTPISDPFINSQIKANINLATLSDIIPLEGTELRGSIIADLDIMGNMSTIEKEMYEQFKADGKVYVSDLYYNSPDVPEPFSLEIADLAFSPKFVEVKSFKSKMGKSDFSLSGKVSNFIPYVLADSTIYGSFIFNANHIDLNEFMSSTSAEETAPASDTSAIEVFEVPSNINFALNSNIKTLLYDKLAINDMVGIIYIRNSRVVMDKLNFNTLEGNMDLSGEYNTQDIKNPLVDLDIKANNIDIPKAFETFGMLEKIAPVVSKATGKISLGFSYTSFIDKSMKPILNTIIGSGSLASKQVNIKGSGTFSAIGEKLNSDAFKELSLNDIDLDFEIRGGRLFVNPFETKMGNTSFTISGDQGLDKTMNYGINISAPKSLFGSANSTINNLAASKGINLAQTDNVNLLVKLSGNMAKPDVKIEAKESLKDAKDAVKEQLKDNAQQLIDTKTDEAKEKARAEADKILAEAEKQAETIRREAKVAADKIRTESKAQAEKLVKEAKNPVAKKAAEISAEKIVADSEKKAQALEKEADIKAQKLLDGAKDRSNALLK
ncbi:MAG: hypothetical protein JXB34_02420 [Bacteroidales bacterium]|nr:hypothetical protein [Bacteroidales bacterium]